MDDQTVLMDGDASGSGPDGALPPPSGSPLGRSPQDRTRWYRTPVSRDSDGNWLGGVVNGLAHAYGFDVRTSRIALAVATLVLPILVFVYIVAWIVLPPSPAQARPVQDLFGGRRRVPLLIVLAAVLVLGGFASFGSWHFLGGIPWGIGLIAVGVLLWLAADIRSERRQVETLTPPPAPTLSDPTAETAIRVTEIPATADETRDHARLERDLARAERDRARAARRAERAAARRARKPIGLFSVLAALVFLAVGAAGDAFDWWNLPILTGTITVLVILAIGAAVSALVNRSWRSVPVLVLLTMAIGLLSITVPHLDGGIGQRTVRPSTIEQAQTLHELGVGGLTVDLTQLLLAPGQVATVHAEVGIGRLHVIVPAAAVLDASVEVGAGAIHFEGQELASGIRHDEVFTDQPTFTPAGAPTGTIVLDAQVGFGDLDIERAPG